MYTAFSGERIRNGEVTRELLEHDAGAYGAIAIRYLNEKVQLPSETERFGATAEQWATLAGHCARMIQKIDITRDRKNRTRRERDQAYREFVGWG